MIKDIRIVQDHGWLQLPDGRLEWGPTQFWLEYQNGLNEWKKLDVVKINELPREDDPLYEPPTSH
jgi:hypothetical protein